MNSSLDLKAALHRMEAVFSNTALECANIFFSLPCAVHEPFKVVETMNPAFDYLLSLAGDSNDYKAISFVGAQKSLLSSLLNKTNITLEDARDIRADLARGLDGL